MDEMEALEVFYLAFLLYSLGQVSLSIHGDETFGHFFTIFQALQSVTPFREAPVTSRFPLSQSLFFSHSA